MSRHATVWEDEQLVGVRCPQSVAKRSPDDDWWVLSVDDGDRSCPICGAIVRLKWAVEVIELQAAPSGTPGGPTE